MFISMDSLSASTLCYFTDIGVSRWVGVNRERDTISKNN